MRQYWWASVGGAACEPAVVSDEGIFTLGCPDPHPADAIELVREIADREIPDTPAEAERKRKEWERSFGGRRHGYRRFA